jgi:hypothetical protein
MSILALTSNTLSTPASAGQIEYNGTIFAATPTNTQRGIIPNEQFFALNAGLAGANATGAQNMFGVGVTLSASTIYEFEMVVALSKSAGTTSHTMAIGFGGTSTLNNIAYKSNRMGSATSFTDSSSSNWDIFVQTASPIVITSATTSATTFFWMLIKGTVSVNSGGTFIPQYTLSAAPSGAYTTAAGSYIKIKPIGVAGANVSVGTWA